MQRRSRSEIATSGLSGPLNSLVTSLDKAAKAQGKLTERELVSFLGFIVICCLLVELLI